MSLMTLLRRLRFSARPQLCENIIWWAVDNGWQTQIIHEPFQLRLSPPVGCEEDPPAHARFEPYCNVGFNAQYLVTIPSASIRSGGLCITPDRQFILESVWRPQQVIDHPAYRDRLPWRRSQWEGNWYSAVGYSAQNYGHWLWDDLPRLLTALPHLPKDIQFVVPNPFRDFHRDSLAAIGVPPERCRPIPNREEVTVDKLYFATFLGHPAWAATAPEVALQLREKLVSKLGLKGDQGPRRLYVSRSNTLFRRLINEDELLPIIRGLGFEVVRPEQLSLMEQIRTFQSANIICGVFGAGLANVIFSHSGTSLLELHEPMNAPRPWFWQMTSVLGHEYQCLTGQFIGDDVAYELNPDFMLSKSVFKSFLENSVADPSKRSARQWWNDNNGMMVRSAGGTPLRWRGAKRRYFT